MSNLPQQFQDRVRDRMKEVIGDLIPDDAWQKMVDQTIADFVRDELPKLVREELILITNQRINAELAKPEWQSKLWTTTGPQPSDMMVEIMKQLAPDMVAQFFGSIAQNIAMNIRNNLPRY